MGAEIGDDAADRLIHAVDHCGEDGHAASEVAAAFLGERGPRGIFLAGVGRGPGVGFRRDDAARREREIGGDEAELLHAREAVGADGVPALGEIQGFVFRDVGLGRVEREVRGVEGEVVEERLFSRRASARKSSE